MVDSGRESLRLLTLTRLWLFSRYMFSLGEWRLWVPISHRAVGYTVAVVGPLWLVLHVLHVPFSQLGLTLHGVLPAVLVWWALRTVGEGARPRDVVGSWCRLGWLVARGGRVRSVRFSGGCRFDSGRLTRVRER